MAKLQKYIERKTNPEIKKLADTLLKAARNNNAPLWKDVARKLLRPARKMAEVNVSKIQRYGGNVVIVPGKVLAAGKIDRPVTVAAFNFSAKAKEKIIRAGGKAISIDELLESNPDGSGVIIME